MLTLCIETSTPQGELALFTNEDVLAIAAWGEEHTHSEIITVKYLELLSKNKTDPNSIKQILVSYGPGSFTGIRVSLNFAKSLAYALDIPIYLTSSFRAEVDFEVLKQVKNLTLLRMALKNRFYVAQYFLDTSNKIVEKVLPLALSISEVEELCKSQTSVNVQMPENTASNPLWSDEFLKNINLLPYKATKSLCQNHMHYFQNSDYGLIFEKSDWKSAYPLYIRASEAEEKLRTGELKVHRQRKL